MNAPIPFEDIFPDLVSWAKPGLKTLPEGQHLVQEALNNQALSYEDRARLLTKGEELLNAGEDETHLFRIGQGIAAGGLAAGAAVRGLGLAGALGKYMDEARRRSRVRLVNEAIQEGGRVDPKFRALLTQDAGELAGTKWPGRVLSVDEMLAGPLQARQGSSEGALGDLGLLLKRRLEKAGLNEFNNGRVGSALRATLEPNRSMWDDLASKAAKLLGGAAEFGHRPLVRAGIAGLAVGGGALLGHLASRDDFPEARSLEDAEQLLREHDSQRARAGASLPLPSTLGRPLAAVRAAAGVLDRPDAKAAMLEDVVGGPLRYVDEQAHLADPNWWA